MREELAREDRGIPRVVQIASEDDLRDLPGTLEPCPFQHQAEVRRARAEKPSFEMRRLIASQPTVGFTLPLPNRRGQVIGAVLVLQLESCIAQDESQTRTFILELTLAMVGPAGQDREGLCARESESSPGRRAIDPQGRRPQYRTP